MSLLVDLMLSVCVFLSSGYHLSPTEVISAVKISSSVDSETFPHHFFSWIQLITVIFPTNLIKRQPEKWSEKIDLLTITEGDKNKKKNKKKSHYYQHHHKVFHPNTTDSCCGSEAFTDRDVPPQVWPRSWWRCSSGRPPATGWRWTGSRSAACLFEVIRPGVWRGLQKGEEEKKKLHQSSLKVTQEQFFFFQLVLGAGNCTSPPHTSLYIAKFLLTFCEGLGDFSVCDSGDRGCVILPVLISTWRSLHHHHNNI